MFAKSEAGMKRTACLAVVLILGACGSGTNHETVSTLGGDSTAPTTLTKASISVSPSIVDTSTTVRTIAADASAPSLVVPAGVPLCVASDVEFLPGAGLWLLRFFNKRGSSCGLAGYPNVSGRLPSGEWQSIPTKPLLLAPTNGPRWTGEFTRELVAVISIRDDSESTCTPKPQPIRYTAIRLELPNGAGNSDIEIGLDFAGCPLLITPFSADSQDR